MEESIIDIKQETEALKSEKASTENKLNCIVNEVIHDYFRFKVI